MKKLFLIFILLLLVFPLFSQKYVQVWADEFNTPGLPDSTKWNYEVGKVRNSELQFYTFRRKENARIEDSVLIIEARKEAWQGSSYTSASLISRYQGDWLYGKFEIRAKVPTGKGTWPAIWMMPTDDAYGDWPKSGEIDIMEYVGMNPSNLYFTAHFGTDSGSGHKSSGNSTTAISQPFSRFITFTLVWSPDKLEWYADGVKYHTYTKTSSDPSVWPFNKMFYFILNLAYGGSWGAQQGIDDTKLPHKFYIDYVRVYQLQESSGPFSLQIDPAVGGTIEVTPKLTSYPEGTIVKLTAKPDDNYEFDKWLHQGSANPISMVVSKDLKLTPLFKKKNELLMNGDFYNGLKGWNNLYFFDSQLNKASVAVIDGVYVMNVTSPGTANWHIVDQQLNLPFTQGYSYKVTFDAWSENPSVADLFISKNYGDYGNYYSTTKNIATTRQSFSWSVRMDKQTDLNCRFGFGFGRFSGRVYLDNVSIQKIIPTETNQLTTASSDLIDVFPNPVQSSLDVRCKSILSNARIQLFNLQGKLVSNFGEHMLLNPGSLIRINLNRPNIENGIYLLNISALEQSVSRKLIINRL